MSASPYRCSQQVLEAVPLVMRAIREEMRSHRTPDVSVPQFRALAFLKRHEGASLSDVAEHIGLTLPSMSKMIDGLVARNLVRRETRPDDRRCLTLSLTEAGRAMQDSARAATQSSLAERFAALSPSDLARVSQTMEILQRLFTPRSQDRR
jgi:DNA-binding MarR family transcriptional regulator